MATKKTESVKARVLVDCAWGKVNEVVELTAEQIEQAKGQVDPAPEAVSYALALKSAS